MAATYETAVTQYNNLHDHTKHLADSVANLTTHFEQQESVQGPRTHPDQTIILDKVLPFTRVASAEELDRPLEDADLQGLSARQLLTEYTTASLAREANEWEIDEYRSGKGKVRFAIQDRGMEALFLAIERHTKNTDPMTPYYRWRTADLHRGGSIRGQIAQTVGTESDPHSMGRQLPGHAASEVRGILAVTSWVAAHCLTGVGIGQAINLRERLDMTEGWRRFSDPEAVSIIYTGEAGMAEGEASEAVKALLDKGGSPVVFVVINNGGGISTLAEEGSTDGDPIAEYRGLEHKGLKIMDVDGSEMQGLFDAGKEAVTHARNNRKPVLLHIKNIPKIHAHSSSDDDRKYLPFQYLKHVQSLDPLPLLQRYLIEHKVITPQELEAIDDAVSQYVRGTPRKDHETGITFFEQGIVQDVLNEHPPNPETLYQDVYAPPAIFAPARIDSGGWQDLRMAELDQLGSTREPHVPYITHYKGEHDADTFPITIRHAENLALAEEMKRHPEIIMFGQDVADFSMPVYPRLIEMFEERFRLFENAAGVNHFSGDAYERMRDAIGKIQEGRGMEVEPVDFAMIAAVMEGKGGVFKTTQSLQMLFGPNRVWNSRLAESSIIGLATGYALAGFTPVVEIQFLPYLDPARNQLKNQLTTMSWRSKGQFHPGMVIRVQGMNRLGGIGAMGHSGANIADYINIPGLRVVMPAHANEAGGLLRESIRVARENGEVVLFIEPINLLNVPGTGYYQGSDAHIPLGEAEIVQEGDGKSFVVLTWSNNLLIVAEASQKWAKRTDRPFNPTLINMRSLGVETDWKTILPYLKRHSRVMIVESERYETSAGAGLSAKINERLFHHQDAPIVRLSARHIRTSAVRELEQYQIPQVDEVERSGIALYYY